MTILDGNGVYGADNTSPALTPKGVIGKVDGTVAATGGIGEMLGTVRESTTVGESFSTRTTTAITGSYADAAVVTLKKGIYIISATTAGYQSDGTPRVLLYGIAINSVMVSTAFSSMASTGVRLCNSITVPVLIKTDDTPVSIRVQCSSVTTYYEPVHEIFAVRIA